MSSSLLTGFAWFNLDLNSSPMSSSWAFSCCLEVKFSFLCPIATRCERFLQRTAILHHFFLVLGVMLGCTILMWSAMRSCGRDLQLGTGQRRYAGRPLLQADCAEFCQFQFTLRIQNKRVLIHYLPVSRFYPQTVQQCLVQNPVDLTLYIKAKKTSTLPVHPVHSQMAVSHLFPELFVQNPLNFNFY